MCAIGPNTVKMYTCVLKVWNCKRMHAACVKIFIRAHTHTHTHTHPPNPCTRKCTHLPTHTNTHTVCNTHYTHMYAHARTRAQAHTHTHTTDGSRFSASWLGPTTGWWWCCCCCCWWWWEGLPGDESLELSWDEASPLTPMDTTLAVNTWKENILHTILHPYNKYTVKNRFS